MSDEPKRVKHSDVLAPVEWSRVSGEPVRIKVNSIPQTAREHRWYEIPDRPSLAHTTRITPDMIIIDVGMNDILNDPEPWHPPMALPEEP